jgi:hypothetical protein
MEGLAAAEPQQVHFLRERHFHRLTFHADLGAGS